MGSKPVRSRGDPDRTRVREPDDPTRPEHEALDGLAGEGRDQPDDQGPPRRAAATDARSSSSREPASPSGRHDRARDEASQSSGRQEGGPPDTWHLDPGRTPRVAMRLTPISLSITCPACEFIDSNDSAKSVSALRPVEPWSSRAHRYRRRSSASSANSAVSALECRDGRAPGRSRASAPAIPQGVGSRPTSGPRRVVTATGHRPRRLRFQRTRATAQARRSSRSNPAATGPRDDRRAELRSTDGCPRRRPGRPARPDVQHVPAAAATRNAGPGPPAIRRATRVGALDAPSLHGPSGYRGPCHDA